MHPDGGPDGPPLAPGPTPAPTLHAGVLEALGADVAAGRLPTGHVVALDALGARFGVSRTVVREAVRVLESLGMVASRRRVGVCVQPLAAWTVLDPRVVRWRLDGPGRTAQWESLTVLREGVEPVAAAEAARRASPADAARLVELAEELERLGAAGDLLAFLEVDVAFHDLLLRCGGNEVLAAHAVVVEQVLRGRTHHDLMPAHPDPRARALHLQAARAVAAGDVEEAEQAVREVVREVRRAALAASGGGQSGGGQSGGGSAEQARVVRDDGDLDPVVRLELGEQP